MASRNKLPLSVTHPELVPEWHPTKNGALLPEQFTFGSNKKVWWQCKNGHEWEAEQKSNYYVICPMCYRRTRIKDKVMT